MTSGMTMVPTSASPTMARSQAPPPLAWRSWPLRDEWRQALPLLAIVGLATASVAWASSRADLTLLALAAMLLSVWRLWVPVRYQINGRGIYQTLLRQRRLPWHSIVECRVRKDGLLLLFGRDTFEDDRYRKVFIPWSDHRAEVLALAEYYLDSRQTIGASSRLIHEN